MDCEFAPKPVVKREERVYKKQQVGFLTQRNLEAS